MSSLLLLDPAQSATNNGDFVIEEGCNKFIKQTFKKSFCVKLSTHSSMSKLMLHRIKNIDFTFVLGSNLLTNKMNLLSKQWDISLLDTFFIRDAILLGTGWQQYQGNCSNYTKLLYRNILSNKYIHSVRDEYTKLKLNNIGINNVINTGCPTMWELTKEHCQDIPISKSNSVIFTLTDYFKDECNDAKMIDILLNNYSNLYFWPQGYGDLDYYNRLLLKLKTDNRIQVIPPNLESLDEFLINNDVDYVGTRLHGGIRAIQTKKRSIIIGIDNRAYEISKSNNLPMLKRDEINNLEFTINNDFSTEIVMPWDNIKIWKEQFTV